MRKKVQVHNESIESVVKKDYKRQRNHADHALQHRGISHLRAEYFRQTHDFMIPLAFDSLSSSFTE
jgi:hypothetical protein